MACGQAGRDAMTTETTPKPTPCPCVLREPDVFQIRTGSGNWIAHCFACWKHTKPCNTRAEAVAEWNAAGKQQSKEGE